MQFLVHKVLQSLLAEKFPLFLGYLASGSGENQVEALVHVIFGNNLVIDDGLDALDLDFLGLRKRPNAGHRQ